MKPVRLFVYILLLLAVLPAAASPAYIHRDGRLLRDSTGKTVQLRGVNLGGWLLWEQWIWGGKFKSQSFIETNLARLAGTEAAMAFKNRVLDHYITENDIRQISACGFNVVRIPLNYRLFDPDAPAGTYTGRGWALLDSTLSWCRRYHVYAIIDLHAAPGGQSPYFIADPQKPGLWKSPAFQDQALRWWKAVALRYRNNRIVAGYDLLNEPIAPSDRQLLDLYQRMIATIRQVDPHHLLVLEGAAFASRFSAFKTLPDDNMAFSFHLYTWLGGNPLKKVKKFIGVSRQLNVPMWCGEWGENGYEVIGQSLKALDDPAAGFSGWCFWTWKKAVVPGKFPALNGVSTSADWMILMKNLGKKAGKTGLTPAQIKAALDDFVAAAGRCTVDTTLLQMLSGKKQ